MTNSYSDFKKYIQSVLNIFELNGTNITPSVIKDTINTIGDKMDKIPQLWRDQVFKEIEYECHSTHTPGAGIFDSYEDSDDFNWYSKSESTRKDSIGFWERYKTYLTTENKIPQSSINTLNNTILPNILNQMGNPKSNRPNQKINRGLIIGDVQSGKTATYIGLIAKAVDAGFKIIVLLAGITESLRQQTQKRIDEGIIGTSVSDPKQEKRENVGVGKYNLPEDINVISMTSVYSDFSGNANNTSVNVGSGNHITVFVIKKNVSVLKRLHNWLKKNATNGDELINTPMLLIDDEADNASVNTKNSETDPTQTNKWIRSICNLFKNATYTGFTATPFANIFIDPDSVDAMGKADLFPEDFIYALDSPNRYVSAEKIFSSTGEYHSSLRYINDIIEPDYLSAEYLSDVKTNIDKLNKGPFYHLHKKEWNGILPDSLTDAIYAFCIANAVRDIRKQQGHRSMLINISRFVKVQKYTQGKVNEIYDTIERAVKVNFSDDIQKMQKLPVFQNFKRVWERHFNNITDVRFEDIIIQSILYPAIENIEVVIVNAKSAKLDYTEDKPRRVIAIGGLALSRGLTLEGLMISYFYRNTSTYDVLMQMGRWFGYRKGYEDLFRIWISQVSAEWYNDISEASIELKNSIKVMFEQQKTPKDFGIRVRNMSKELKITAPNKMRNTYETEEQYTFYGEIYDTPYLSTNPNLNHTNLKAVEDLYKTLKRENELKSVANKSKSKYFADINKEHIITFMSKIKCSIDNINFNTNNILRFLEDPQSINIEDWDVLFVSGESDKYYPIDGLRTIPLVKREIFVRNTNTLQITSRRSLLTGGSEGRATLTAEQVDTVQKACYKKWKEAYISEETIKNKQISNREYFQYLPNRKPLLVILMIDVTYNSTPDDKTTIAQTFIDNLKSEPVVAFAMGIPGVKTNIEPQKYTVNKTYHQMQIQFMEEESEDEE